MRHVTLAILLTLICCPVAQAQRTIAKESDQLPQVGDEAANFSLTVLGPQRSEGEAEKANLHEQLEMSPVVLLVLRGYPGYQCPICSRQVGQFLREADKFAEAKVAVWMVYPGPAEELDRFAREFIASRKLPKSFKLLLDPDYGFTNAWHLRWDAPRETAYPSTFIIGMDKKIKFAKISKSHGGRSRPDEVLKALEPQPQS